MVPLYLTRLMVLCTSYKYIAYFEAYTYTTLTDVIQITVGIFKIHADDSKQNQTTVAIEKLLEK